MWIFDFFITGFAKTKWRIFLLLVSSEEVDVEVEVVEVVEVVEEVDSTFHVG